MKHLIRVFTLTVLCVLMLSVNANATIYTVPGPVSSEEIVSRIRELTDILGGRCFTANQTASETVCRAGTEETVNNTDSAVIVEAQWFCNQFGELSTCQFPCTWTESGASARSGMACAGFASFAEWYLFHTAPTDRVNTEKIGTCKISFDALSGIVKTGDLLRFDDAHSAILTGIVSDGLFLLDCNGLAELPFAVRNEKVSFLLLQQHFSAVTISRAVSEAASTATEQTPATEINQVYLSVNGKFIVCQIPDGARQLFIGEYDADGRLIQTHTCRVNEQIRLGTLSCKYIRIFFSENEENNAKLRRIG